MMSVNCSRKVAAVAVAVLIPQKVCPYTKPIYCKYLLHEILIIKNLIIDSIGNVPMTCEDIFNDGKTLSGDYSIDPDGPGPLNTFTVYCDVNKRTSLRIFFFEMFLFIKG